ncbi:uncharacterized protein TNCV_4566871 [Trichonephila clavipes]|nr:uncharacterized protein TNCV_4566871 [Trichonephila clavipes]
MNGICKIDKHQDGRIRVWRHRCESKLAECIRLRHNCPSPGMMVWSAVGRTSRSPLVHIDGTLNSAGYIFVCYDPCLYILFEPYETLHFRKIMHDRILSVLCRSSFILKMFDCFSFLHVHLISHQQKTSDPWLLND